MSPEQIILIKAVLKELNRPVFTGGSKSRESGAMTGKTMNKFSSKVRACRNVGWSGRSARWRDVGRALLKTGPSAAQPSSWQKLSARTAQRFHPSSECCLITPHFCMLSYCRFGPEPWTGRFDQPSMPSTQVLQPTRIALLTRSRLEVDPTVPHALAVQRPRYQPD